MDKKNSLYNKLNKFNNDFCEIFVTAQTATDQTNAEVLAGGNGRLTVERWAARNERTSFHSDLVTYGAFFSEAYFDFEIDSRQLGWPARNKKRSLNGVFRTDLGLNFFLKGLLSHGPVVILQEAYCFHLRIPTMEPMCESAGLLVRACNSKRGFNSIQDSERVTFIRSGSR